MKITRTLTTAAAVAAAAALGFAASASADPGPINGTYAVDDGADGAVVTVSSNCATNGCTANLASNLGWTSVATLTNGQWNFTVTKPDGVVCDDGSYAPVRIAYTVNAASLKGTLVADSNGDCPGGQITEAPFQLTKLS
ncbi:hypothetical protein ORI20_26640 [Mycobacterium sp. CVI_P3]|uniref:Secreted protein n=1 Tax=Mycobacterium pinniadriaticum TaxID=2994102 RepID=A0ABT3SLA0_9MYCO|nr:hypothetical protein [Mycobacterium pinniadriaticum]MCX2933854.1 hypothetical protein [Mycobacterium pinniadriaticum]MCX2940293.1 hypothetical protein [Mycobacterium pinniadriaticum]